MIEAARAAGRCRVIAVNNNWRRLPKADVLYAADGHWWRYYLGDLAPIFPGELWTSDASAAREMGLCYVRTRGGRGLSRDPTLVHSGGNSGYQAINIAFHFGARRILLVGYDMQRTGGEAHWHGDHPDGWGNSTTPEKWVPKFADLATDLAAEAVSVANCSIASALQCFQRSDLKEALAAIAA